MHNLLLCWTYTEHIRIQILIIFFLQAASLNSVARALAKANVARALRMASLMATLGLPVYAQTHVALIGGCARQHRSAEAHALYWCASQACLLPPA